MLENNQPFFINNELFKTSETLIVAVSGGVDSMVLLNMILTLDNPVVIAHVNHKKRTQSDQEYTYLKNFALTKKIPFEGYILKKHKNRNFQHFARNERLTFFKKIAHKYNTDKVLLAHHKDDQTETICMRYAKSKNILDLTGMNVIQKYKEIQLVRPLLNISKCELLTYAQKNHIHYFEDSTNKDLRYTRNAFRHKIIPEIKLQNPNFETQLLSLSNSVVELKKRIYNHIIFYSHLWNNHIPIDKFSLLSPLLQEELLRHSIGAYNSKPMSRNHLREIIRQLNQSQNLKIKLFNDLVLHKEYNFFFFVSTTQKKYSKTLINAPGTYKINSQYSFIVTHDKLTHMSSNYFVLWYNDIVFPLYIRTREAGDQIKLSFGHKKIKDIYIDKKISPMLRDTIFLLANQKEVLWIPFLKLYKHQDKKSHKIYIYEVRNVRERY